MGVEAGALEDLLQMSCGVEGQHDVQSIFNEQKHRALVNTELHKDSVIRKKCNIRMSRQSALNNNKSGSAGSRKEKSNLTSKFSQKSKLLNIKLFLKC